MTKLIKARKLAPLAILDTNDDWVAAVFAEDQKKAVEAANLIAAAPDLLRFAQWVLDMDPESDLPLFAKARAAIAKAEQD